MRTVCVLFSFQLLLAGIVTAFPLEKFEGESAFQGGDGSSTANAIRILGKNFHTGINAEYDYLKRHYPGYTPVMQALMIGDQGRKYDKIEIKTSGGETKSVYFDITDFYGKGLTDVNK